MTEYPEDGRGDTLDHRDLRSNLREAQKWYNIKLAAKTDPVLKDAMDQLVVLYELRKPL
jgi:hypothetical protein